MNTDKIKELTASDALNEIERAGRLFKAFERSAEVLSYMVGLEQHERELKDSIANLNERNEKANEKLRESREQTVKTIQAANDKAAGIIDKALGEAVGIEQKATIDARSLADQANASADAACGRRDSMVDTGIEEEVKAVGETLASAAGYKAQHGDLPGALKLIDASLAIEQTWYNTWLKADILHHQEDHKSAYKLALQAQDLGNAAGEEFFYKERVTKALAEWKKK